MMSKASFKLGNLCRLQPHRLAFPAIRIVRIAVPDKILSIFFEIISHLLRFEVFQFTIQGKQNIKRNVRAYQMIIVHSFDCLWNVRVAAYHEKDLRQATLFSSYISLRNTHKRLPSANEA